jgi:hypothetical protein
MKLAIMQPYFFPYIGYFQLAAAVDRFVFLDDVDYIKGGWINRNRLRISGAVRYITIPVTGVGPGRKINQVQVEAGDRWRRKLLQGIIESYSCAPHFQATFALLEEALSPGESCVGAIARNSVTAVARYLGLGAQFIASSSVYGNRELPGSRRVLDICRQEGATEYHNLPGGRALYSPDEFRARGIDLRFVEPVSAPYPQGHPGFDAGLSILDVLMFNDADEVRRLLYPKAKP